MSESEGERPGVAFQGFQVKALEAGHSVTNTVYEPWLDESDGPAPSPRDREEEAASPLTLRSQGVVSP